MDLLTNLQEFLLFDICKNTEFHLIIWLHKHTFPQIYTYYKEWPNHVIYTISK